MKNQTNCESCIHYVFDDEVGYFFCEANLDQDEMGRFMTGATRECSYYFTNDDYKIVLKQN